MKRLLGSLNPNSLFSSANFLNDYNFFYIILMKVDDYNMRKIIASLDIGSCYTKMVVGEVFKGRIEILASSYLPTKGYKKGIVTNEEALIDTISKLRSKCEGIINEPIREVIIGVREDNAEFFTSTGMTTLSGEEDERQITNDDIINAMQASTYNKIDNDREIVAITPISYKVDDEKVTGSVLNIIGKRLDIETLVVTIPRENIIPIAKVLKKLNLKIVDYTLTSIASYNAFKNELLEQNIGIIVELGYEKTSISLFNKGLITNTKLLKEGTYNIIKEIHNTYGLNKKDSIDALHNLGNINLDEASSSLKKTYETQSGEKITINEYELSNLIKPIIISNLKEIKRQINILTKKEIHYIMFTGGISDLEGFVVSLDEVFHHLAKVGQTRELGTREAIYKPALGLIKYLEDKTRAKEVFYSMLTEEEQDDLSTVEKRVDKSILSKLFGYFN